MEAKQHASEQPTNHRRNQKEIKICIETNEKETFKHGNQRVTLLATSRESPSAATKTQWSWKLKKKKNWNHFKHLF